MKAPIAGLALLAFLMVFSAMWIAVTALLGAIASWPALARRYPDRPGEARRRFTGQSGLMGGGVHMNGILTLSVCETGLRIGVWRLFGPFSPPFLVPWSDISVDRRRRFLQKRARLGFGAPEVGSLEVQGYIADRLARAAGRSWPEPGPFPVETPGQTLGAVAGEWAAMTAIAAAFFTLVPRLASGGAAALPIAVTIAFPAVVFGFVAAFRYLDRRRV